MYTNTKVTGTLGETLAVAFLQERGYEVIEQNYTKKWGEIDIIATKDNVVHFVEVKAVSYVTRKALDFAVTHETWRPEELVHRFKLHQLEKAITTWISEKQYGGDWQIDVAAVRLVPRETFAVVNYIENVS